MTSVARSVKVPRVGASIDFAVLSEVNMVERGFGVGACFSVTRPRLGMESGWTMYAL